MMGTTGMSPSEAPPTDICVQLLGDTVLWCAGTPHRITAPRLRTVLALLLSAPGQVCAVDALAAEVWTRPPPHAVTTVQSYLYQLRRHFDAISAGGSRHLVTNPSHYLTVFDTDAVDVLRFQALANAGLAALPAGDPERAAALLTEALDIWRGEPFADVPLGPRLTAIAARLRELHNLVELSRIDAEMLCGRHVEVLPALRSLVDSQPLCESFTARLMVALARSGQLSAAIATYDQLSDRLGETLGLQPMARLQRIRATLATPHLLPEWEALHYDERAGEDRAIVTSHLPSQTIPLAGRATEITAVSNWLIDGAASEGGCRIATLHGPAGVGKTSVCLAVARQVQRQFPDGMLVVDLGAPGSAACESNAVTREILDRAGESTDGMSDTELLARYRSWSSTRRLLFVLDNALCTDQVAPLLPTCAQAAVLVTSEIRLGGLAGARHYMLEVLDEDSTVLALHQCMGARWHEEDQDAVAQVARHCHGLPLAVQAVAQIARSRSLGPASLASLIADDQARWEQVSATAPRFVEQLDRSWRRLDADSRTAWLVLGALSEPFDIAEAARRLDVTELRARSLLNRMREVSVLREFPADDGGHRFGVYDLARRYPQRHRRRSTRDEPRRREFSHQP